MHMLLSVSLPNYLIFLEAIMMGIVFLTFIPQFSSCRKCSLFLGVELVSYDLTELTY